MMRTRTTMAFAGVLAASALLGWLLSTGRLDARVADPDEQPGGSQASVEPTGRHEEKVPGGGLAPNPGGGDQGAGSDARDLDLTTAERVVRLERAVTSYQEWVAELRGKRDDPGAEYPSAEKDLLRIDGQLTAAKNALREVEDKKEADKVVSLRERITRLQRPRDRAKRRFDLSIEQRRAFDEQIEILGKIIDRDRKRIAELTGGRPSADDKTKAEKKSPEGAREVSSPAPELPAEEAKALTQAEQDVSQRAQRLRAAEQDATNIEERLAYLDKIIVLERKLREIARMLGEIAEEARQDYDKESRDESAKGVATAALQTLQQEIRDAEDRARRAGEEVKRHTDRLDRLQESRAINFRALALAGAGVERARAALEKARSRIEHLQNPFSARNVEQWLLNHGPKLLAIGLGGLALYWFTRVLSSRLVRLMVSRSGHGTEPERESRAQTLVGVFRSAATLVIAAGGVLMALEEVGIPVVPLLGGAAVLGLAVAFGAQNLIRDFFYGFMILLENQYKLHDVVKIGDHAGQVEQITLRLTALRDLEGNCHFIPNGEVKSVVNMTHGWSRALFDLGVAQVMEVVRELAAEMRRDGKFGPSILADLEMLGVDALADSTVVLKFFLKTRPLKQWDIKREFLRRIKKRFDELGICRTASLTAVGQAGGR
jgi:moderate conductance mechanosensitive channel